MPGPAGPSPKLLGTLGAIALACVFLLILWFTRTPTTKQQPANNDLFPDSTDILDITELSSSDGMIVTMTDKQDPTRVASTLAADRFEPIGNGKRRLDRPVAWIYQRDGGAIQIQADTGIVVMPDPNQPPESGTLSGNVTIRSFPSTPAPGTPPDENATPTMVTRFETPVEFERRYLRLRSQGRFTIHSDQIDFAGHDLTIMLNEVRDRIELIDIRKGEQLVIRPKSKAEKPIAQTATESKRAQGANASNPATSPQATTPSKQPSITRYRVSFADEVLARVIGTGSITADSLDIWALLQDGQLRDNAIAQITIAQTETKPASPTKASAPAPQTPTPLLTNTPTHAPGDFVITWAGPLIVNPLDDDADPIQLASDDLTIEMNASVGNTVEFNAPQHQITGTANRVAYHATTATLALHASEQSPSPTEIIIENAGSIRTSRINASFKTGQIAIDSAGIIHTTPSGSPGAQLTWKDNASFDIALNDDGSLSNRLQQATFAGTVQGSQDGNQIAGSVITAVFDPSSPPESSLRKLRFINGVIVSNTNASLGGNILDIDFTPGSMGFDLDPIRVMAKDSVFGRTHDELLRAEELTVTLARDLTGRTFARTANAKTNVRYTGKNRTTAKADTFQGDGVREQLTLIGTPEQHAQVAQGGSTITGNRIDLNARNRSLLVSGPGTFEHDVALEDPTSNGHLRVRWNGSMQFDDAIGSIQCEDAVTVVSTPDAYTRDTLQAHRIEIDLSPMPTAEPIGGQPLPDRELLAARAYGRVMPGQDPIAAKIESRTYAHDDPERVIGLLYLEGPQIFANNTRQTLAIPAPGTLLVMDRTTDNNDSAPLGSSGPGLTRFNWQGRMDLDRKAGIATMRDDIFIQHKSLTDGQTMTVTCDSLEAAFELASQSGGTNRLLNAQAIGTVIFRAQTRQLFADKARFNAIDETVFASAIDNNLVTLHDTDQPAPVSAKTLLWDLARDRIEVNAPSPVHAPSGP